MLPPTAGPSTAGGAVHGAVIAIHTMSPGRGDGANIALKDAQMLLRALQGVTSGTTVLASATRGYQASMLQYGFQAVADSRDRPFMRMARR